MQVGGNPRSLVPNREAQRIRVPLEIHPHGRAADGRRIGGVADQVEQHLVEEVGVPVQVGRLQRRCKFEPDAAVTQQAALELHAGADGADGVETAPALARAADAITDGAQEVKRAVHRLPHVRKLAQQL